jgi:two-component system, sensor histidine kinase and response regulator
MKTGSSKFILYNEKLKGFLSKRFLESLKGKWPALLQKVKHNDLSVRMERLSQRSQHYLEDIKSLGLTKKMDDLERRKLSVFNQLNFFQFVTGIIVPVSCFFGNNKFPLNSFFIASLPAWVSLLVLYINFYYRYEAGMLTYFVLYPLVNSIVYMNGMNLGVELFFILNGILAVFFLQEISQMVFSIGFSMVSYFVLAVINKNYPYQLQTANFFFYLFNQIAAIAFIFYGLFLIKKENNLYELGILATNRELQETNEKIEKQKLVIEEKAKELDELNSLKNKLFSVISHDLKTPMYALRNLFGSMQQMNVSGKEIKQLIPDVVSDIGYLTGLMENLLLWAKSQMNAGSLQLREIDMGSMVEEVVNDQYQLESGGILCGRCGQGHDQPGIAQPYFKCH